ncbi:MAG: BatA and WFA domain-containing protein [Saprospiraceae bacterium]|nr:BatA and WFA domain-containing protein [Saprospiraceae bacterium]
MQFLFPTFLIASLVIAIPILIHLFNFRRYKKVYFTNVAFLKSIQQASNSRRKINQWLILACRCLALIALVLAFAQPFFETKGKVVQGTNYSIIYIDNSFSMGSKATDHNLLETGKDIAHSVINGFGPDDKFMVVSNDNSNFSSDWMNKEEALSAIDEKTISPQSRSLSSIFKGMQQSFKLAGQGKFNAYFISDFQKDFSNIPSLNDTAIQVNLIPVTASSVANVYIDTVYFKNQISQPGIANKLVYKIVNDAPYANTVKPVLKYHGNNKPLPLVKIEAGKTLVDTVPILSSGGEYQSAELLINDNPITFDNNYFIAWKDAVKANVLIINENNTNRYLEAAMSSSGLFSVTNVEVSKVNYSSLSQFPLIILNEVKSLSSGLISELNKSLSEGNNLVVFPGLHSGNAIKQLSGAFNLGTDGNFYNQVSQVQTINNKDDIFQNVFEGRTSSLKLPVTQSSLRILTKVARGAVSLLSYRDGYPFLVKYPRGNGKIFLCAAPLDPTYSDFVKNGEVLVPFLFKSGFNNLSKQLAFIIGRSQSFEILRNARGKDVVVKFTGPQTFIPEQIQRNKKSIIQVGKENILPGIYSLENYGKYAFNYDRSESRMEFLDEQQLKSFESPHIKVWDSQTQTNLASLIQEKDSGLALWKYLLIAALIFLLGETYFIRLGKK